MTYSKHTDDAKNNSAERFITLLANTTYNSDLQNYIQHIFTKISFIQ